MAAYDHWLWRLFYWLMGYRWHWVELPDDAVADVPVGGYLRWHEDILRVTDRYEAVGGVDVMRLARRRAWWEKGLGYALNDTAYGVVDMSSAVPLRRCLAHKDWYAAIKAQPVWRD
jgi:hypothetical protein